MNTEEVTRFEVIDHTEASRKEGHTCRKIVLYNDNLKVEVSLQDNGRTLKIFLSDKPMTLWYQRLI